MRINAFHTQKKRDLLGAGPITLAEIDTQGNVLGSTSFMIERVLSEGGFSIAYYAHEKKSAKRVVLKELYPNHPSISRQESDGRLVFPSESTTKWAPFHEAFLREYAITERASSIISADRGVFRAGDVFSPKLYEASNGNLYMVLDTLQGNSLTQEIAAGWASADVRTTSPNARLELIIQALKSVCRTLGRLHDAGILHLDCHGQNIHLVEASGSIRTILIDFGNAIDVTIDGGIPNSIPYAITRFSPPEMWALSEYGGDLSTGYSPSPESDLFSIVALLFYACMGEISRRTIYDRKKWMATVEKYFPSASYPGVAAQLTHIFTKGLGPQWDRFHSAEELWEALDVLEKLYKQGGILKEMSANRRAAIQLLDTDPPYKHVSHGDNIARLLFVGCSALGKEVIAAALNYQALNVAMSLTIVAPNTDGLATELHQIDQSVRSFADKHAARADSNSNILRYRPATVQIENAQPVLEDIIRKYNDHTFVFIDISESTMENRIFAEALSEALPDKTIHYSLSAMHREPTLVSHSPDSNTSANIHPVGANDAKATLFHQKMEALALEVHIGQHLYLSDTGRSSSADNKNESKRTPLPPPPRDYVERKDVEDLIVKVLEGGSIACLFGETGMGKTTLAINVLNNGSYAKTIYIAGETPGQVLESLGCQPDEGRPLHEIFHQAITAHLKGPGQKAILLDNLGYDQGEEMYQNFETQVSKVLDAVHREHDDVHIIVTTRRRRTTMTQAAMIRVGDMTEVQALEFLEKDFAYDFDPEAALSLVRKYGQPAGDGTHLIPAIECVRVKNAATLFHGYHFLRDEAEAEEGLGKQMHLQKKAILRDARQGKLFLSLLEISSFLDSTAIPEELLISICRTLYRENISTEHIKACLKHYDSVLTLLNYTTSNTLSIHRAFQREINIGIQNRAEISRTILTVLLHQILPLSYYGTVTIADPQKVMPHALTFFQRTKNEKIGNEDYRSLLRAMGWYFGHVRRDKEASAEIYEALFRKNRAVVSPDFHALMGQIDKLILDAENGRGLGDEDDDVLDLQDDIESMEDDSSQKDMLYMRFHLQRAMYHNHSGTLAGVVHHVTEGLTWCEAFFNRPNKTTEEHVFCVEHKVLFYCKLAGAERKKMQKYEDSLAHLNLALDLLSDRPLRRALKKMGFENNQLYLQAFCTNLIAVTLMERETNLRELFQAEERFLEALSTYSSLNHYPSMANQLINLVNLYTIMSIKIVDKVNEHIRSAGEPSSPEEWQVQYAREDEHPTLLHKDGTHKPIKEWIALHHLLVEKAKKTRKEYRQTRKMFFAPLSRAAYCYLHPLALSQIHYNALTNEEKKSILLHAYDHQTPSGEQDGLVTGLSMQEVDVDQTILIRRYHGDLCTKLAAFSSTREEKAMWLERGRPSLDLALEKARRIERTQAVEKILKLIQNWESEVNRL